MTGRLMGFVFRKERSGDSAVTGEYLSGAS